MISSDSLISHINHSCSFTFSSSLTSILFTLLIFHISFSMAVPNLLMKLENHHPHSDISFNTVLKRDQPYIPFSFKIDMNKRAETYKKISTFNTHQQTKETKELQVEEKDDDDDEKNQLGVFPNNESTDTNNNGSSINDNETQVSSTEKRNKHHQKEKHGNKSAVNYQEIVDDFEYESVYPERENSYIHSNQISSAAIVGISIGSIAIACILSFSLIVLYKKKKFISSSPTHMHSDVSPSPSLPPSSNFDRFRIQSLPSLLSLSTNSKNTAQQNSKCASFASFHHANVKNGKDRHFGTITRDAATGEYIFMKDIDKLKQYQVVQEINTTVPKNLKRNNTLTRNKEGKFVLEQKESITSENKCKCLPPSCSLALPFNSTAKPSFSAQERLSFNPVHGEGKVNRLSIATCETIIVHSTDNLSTCSDISLPSTAPNSCDEKITVNLNATVTESQANNGIEVEKLNHDNENISHRHQIHLQENPQFNDTISNGEDRSPQAKTPCVRRHTDAMTDGKSQKLGATTHARKNRAKTAMHMGFTKDLRSYDADNTGLHRQLPLSIENDDFINNDRTLQKSIQKNHAYLPSDQNKHVSVKRPELACIYGKGQFPSLSENVDYETWVAAFQHRVLTKMKRQTDDKNPFHY